jgi:hypothetical protein
MLFANPVDPSQTIRIHYQSPAGPASAFPRNDEGMDGTLKLLAAAALLAVGYVIGGFAMASVAPVDPTPIVADGGAGHPVSKVGGYSVGAPVPGEFRLAPGNLQPAGIAGR